MQRSRYTHIAKQVFPYSQESTTGSLQRTYHNRSPYISQVNNLYLPLVETNISIIGKPLYLSLVPNHIIYHRVLIKYQTAGPFDPKYIGDNRIVSWKGNQVKIRPADGGKMRMEHVSNVKYILPAEKYIEQHSEYENFSHKSKHWLIWTRQLI